MAAGEGGRETQEGISHDSTALTEPHDREHTNVHRRRRHATAGRDGPIDMNTSSLQKQSLHIHFISMSLSPCAFLIAESITARSGLFWKSSHSELVRQTLQKWQNWFRKWTFEVFSFFLFLSFRKEHRCAASIPIFVEVLTRAKG